jgi:FAD/FMN-containing dehydrogenase
LRTRTRRLVRFVRWLGKLLAFVLIFGLLVSIGSLWLVPDAHVGRRPDPAVKVEEVTRLYPVDMQRVIRPTTVAEIADAVRGTAGPISIGGGRYSMGGQTATPGGVQLDLRDFHGVVAFDPKARIITVHSGTRWREVQQAIDRANLAVKIMQTYNSFTVGGSLSVNAHGRYIGEGPLVRSVRAITLVLADGRVVSATPTENRDLFYGAIGGYGALGVIGDVTLDLAENSRVRRDDVTLKVEEYPALFRAKVRNDTTAVFHNADMYPPAFRRLRAITYRRTQAELTDRGRLHPPDQSSWVHRLAYRIMSSGSAGLWVREHVIDPWVMRGNPVTWRNYEASYDVSELEPSSRSRKTYVLQEYFIPVDSFLVFVPRMRRILQSHRVNAINVSVRHALKDPGTLLAWAPEEMFAFVLYYKQGVTPDDRREVARWTRALIDAALQSGGRYYLPYQPVATREQFGRAYPRSAELVALKRRVDPTGKFTNVLWDLYAPGPDGRPSPVSAARMPAVLPGEAQQQLDSVPGYPREQGAEFLTHPEWDLVYSSQAYARWLTERRRPSGFPYFAAVGTFWRSYLGAWRASQQAFPADVGTHVMLWVIGMSTAVEYGLKGLYENTVGRLAEADEPLQGTAEEAYAARVSQDYADLIVRKGWYEFDFGSALGTLWSKVPLTGPGMLRKLERRFALTGEYGIKAVYAWLIGLGTKSAYAPDELQRDIVIAGWSDSLAERVRRQAPELKVARALDRGYTLLTIPRYLPFRDALLVMSQHAGQLRLAEISGCDIVTLTGTAPVGWRAPGRAEVVTSYRTPAQSGWVRVLLSVPARDLLDVLAAVRTEGAFHVDHVYDY